MRSAAVHLTVPAPLQKFRAPESGKKILVAVSGGLDSMALLHLLKRFSSTRGWKLAVAHFNHHLRGRASDADEALVCKTAAAMKLPFVSGGADVKKIAGEAKLSIEMAARKLRHQFLAQAAHKNKINLIALAHHADDQVELFFLRLLRGAGGSLGGMKGRSPSPADRKISLVRPLLDFSKAELEVYAQENKIRYREDATNFPRDILRNRIRHELLPLLRRHYQPGLNKAVLRLMEIAGAESDFTAEIARGWLGGNKAKAIPVKSDFEKLPTAVQRQVLKQQLAALGLPLDFDLVESLRRSANQSIAAGANISVSRDAKGRVSARMHRLTEFNNQALRVELDKRGTAIFDGAKVKWELSARHRNAKPFAPSGKPGVEFFDADNITGKITLRHWQPGDRFQPMGFKSAAKLQDLFTNKKIPREQRHHLILAEAGEKIFWVEGLRISENFKLTPETKRILIWRWRR
jgi:tRNA(Ile)-lysidine synthase